VINISYIRIKPGMFDKYMKYLDTDYKKNLEAQKQAGIILDYGVYSSPQTAEGDWNMVLTVTYKNRLPSIACVTRPNRSPSGR
jgi:hypothetical protein